MWHCKTSLWGHLLKFRVNVLTRRTMLNILEGRTGQSGLWSPLLPSSKQRLVSLFIFDPGTLNKEKVIDRRIRRDTERNTERPPISLRLIHSTLWQPARADSLPKCHNSGLDGTEMKKQWPWILGELRQRLREGTGIHITLCTNYSVSWIMSHRGGVPMPLCDVSRDDCGETTDVDWLAWQHHFWISQRLVDGGNVPPWHIPLIWFSE